LAGLLLPRPLAVSVYGAPVPPARVQPIPIPPAPVRPAPGRAALPPPSTAPPGAPPPNWNTSPNPTAPSTRKTHPIQVDSDEYSDISVTGIRTLRGNVRIASEGTTLRTALAQYNVKTDVAVSPGKVQIDDDRNTLIANTGTAYYRTRAALLQGTVTITVRPTASSTTAPQGSARREFRDPVTIYCDRVDYDWRTRVAVATGHLMLKQVTSQGVTRTVTAKRLTYEANAERVTLNDDVHSVDSKGQKADGSIAIAVIKDGAEEFRMGTPEKKGAHILIQVEDEDQGDKDTKGKAGATGPTLPPIPSPEPSGPATAAPAATPTPATAP